MPPTVGSAVFGYSVLSQFQGRGFATELLSSLITRVFS